MIIIFVEGSDKCIGGAIGELSEFPRYSVLKLNWGKNMWYTNWIHGTKKSLNSSIISNV